MDRITRNKAIHFIDGIRREYGRIQLNVEDGM